MGRIIVYGDIHGCLDEWRLLRSKIGVRSGDAEISVGDLLSKGPRPVETLRYARENGVLTILGNHEERFLEIAGVKRAGLDEVVHRASLKHYERLSSADLAYLFAMPRFLKVANLTVVHAGLTNGIHLGHLQEEHKPLLTRLRYVSKGAASPEYVFWSELYNGSQGFVVYGHTPGGVRRDDFALGIDTGCVYGDRLTAAIFEWRGSRLDTAGVKIEQVSAKERYA
ncbi:MAG: metallophosphoesterase [Campylobacterales bacterium]